MPPISGLERPQLATQALLSGDVAGSWEAMLQPETLTPAQKDAYLEKLGVKGSVYENLFQAVTNPALIISLILSHKFPVPVGKALFNMSKEVSGMASRLPILRSFASPQAIFRGTALPETLEEIAGNMMDFQKRASAAYTELLQQFQTTTGRLPSTKEQVLLSAYLHGMHKKLRGFGGKNGVVRLGSGETTAQLEGVKVLFPNLEKKMEGPLLDLAKGTRKILDQQRDEVFNDPTNRKRILRAISRLKKQGLIDEEMAAFIQDPRKIEDYFPMRVVQTDEDFRRMMDALTSSGSAKRFAKSAEKKATAWATPEVMKRNYAMVPDFRDLSLVSEYLDPAEFTKLQRIIKARLFDQARKAGVRMEVIRKLDPTPLAELLEKYPTMMQAGEAAAFAGVLAEHGSQRYSLKFMPVINSYNHTLAGTYAWTIKGGGEKMQAFLNEARGAAQLGDARAKWRVNYLENTVLPMAMGRDTFRRAIKAQLWDQGMARLAGALEKPAIREVFGEGLTKLVGDHLKNSQGAFSFMNLQTKAAGYFYLSTLGLNVGSALTNMMQNVLTLGPTIGFRTAAAGMSSALQKSHKYFALRLGERGLTHEAALIEAYPEFAKAGLVSAPITEEVIQNTLRNAYDIARLPSKAATATEKISRAMMSTFTASETANRLAAFEAGMIHAGRAGLDLDESILHARKLVNLTQFPSSVANTPAALASLPPLFRQFLGFPTKMLEFATSTAFTLGSGEKSVLGYNPGTFARMIAGSVLAMELGDTLGVDLRSSLFTGAIPIPDRPGKLFSPIPVVPPFFQITGAAAQGLATGDFSELARSTPLLIPGGIQAFKVAGLLPPQVPGAEAGRSIAQAFERTYADYQQPAPDGRIAVYSGQGTFRGYYTPWDLTKLGLGVRGGDLDKEQELLATVTKGRDQIIEAKKGYMDARFRNDPRTANTIATQFQQQFGFKLPVSDKDIKAMQTRRTVSRLEQLIRTSPPGESRTQMIGLLSATMGASAKDIIGVDPAMLGQPRPVAEKSRQAYRRTFPNNRFNPQTDLGPQDQIEPQRIGRQPGVSVAGSPF